MVRAFSDECAMMSLIGSGNHRNRPNQRSQEKGLQWYKSRQYGWWIIEWFSNWKVRRDNPYNKNVISAQISYPLTFLERMNRKIGQINKTKGEFSKRSFLKISRTDRDFFPFLWIFFNHIRFFFVSFLRVFNAKICGLKPGNEAN